MLYQKSNITTYTSLKTSLTQSYKHIRLKNTHQMQHHIRFIQIKYQISQVYETDKSVITQTVQIFPKNIAYITYNNYGT